MRHNADLHALMQSTCALVMDEADRLLLGDFKTDIDAVLTLVPPSEHRQLVMLSATFSPELLALARAKMRPEYKTVDMSEGVVPKRLVQSSLVVEDTARVAALKAILDDELASNQRARIICFFNTVAMTQYMTDLFDRVLLQSIIPMHSGLTMAKRFKNWRTFQRRKRAVMFTSDVSARGMDYDGVSLVVQFGLASSPDIFVHRSGRTARAGHDGASLAILGKSEEAFLAALDQVCIA